jgi:hypothetical protein
MERLPDASVPCGHKACSECAFRIASTNRRCWMCREPFHNVCSRGQSVSLSPVQVVPRLMVEVRLKTRDFLSFGAASVLLAACVSRFSFYVAGVFWQY